MDNMDRVTGWWIFAGVLLFIGGVLDIIWGIAALGDSKFFTENVTHVFQNLHTWGWISIIIGVIELVAAFSLFAGGGFGRVIGIIAGSLAAISALLTISVAPFWGLCVFFLSVVIVYELAKAPEAGS